MIREIQLKDKEQWEKLYRGYAFAYRKYSTKFIKDEEFAKANKLGMWAMTFQYTWDFRKASRKNF